MSVRVFMVPSVAMSVQKNFLMIANIKTFSIKSCYIYKKDKNGCFILDFFSIRSVQNGSNLIKLDQIGFLTNQKSVTIKSCHIYRKDKNGCFVFDFFGSDLSKMDQTGSNWISHQPKNATKKVVTLKERVKMTV